VAWTCGDGLLRVGFEKQNPMVLRIPDDLPIAGLFINREISPFWICADKRQVEGFVGREIKKLAKTTSDIETLDYHPTKRILAITTTDKSLSIFRIHRGQDPVYIGKAP